MDHVAIMRKSWELIPKILNGRKTIESRWSRFKIAPWGRIKKGDRIYFKNSGEKVTVVASVSKILEFENLNSNKIKEILHKYGGEGKISINSFSDTYKWAKEKKYCTLIYLEKARKVAPFNISKNGFGTGTAWLTVNSVEDITIGMGKQ